MLPTMNADGVPARIIVSKEGIFADRHRIFLDFDFDWDKEGINYVHIKQKLMAHSLRGILIKTRGGCHFISSYTTTFANALNVCYDFTPHLDIKYIEMSKKRRYFALRISQKYEEQDLEVDNGYAYHDGVLEDRYNKLLARYKDYFKYRKPLTYRKMTKPKGDLLDKYQKKVIGSPEPVFENSYGEKTSTRSGPRVMYNSSY